MFNAFNNGILLTSTFTNNFTLSLHNLGVPVSVSMQRLLDSNRLTHTDSVLPSSSFDDVLESLLQNNEAPPSEFLERAKIKINERSNKLSKLDEEIRGLQRRLEQLQAQREEIDKSLDTYRTVASPFRRVPRDILEEIFVRCLPGHRYPTMESSDAPVLLTQVCRTWREVAFSFPRLWCELHFPWIELAETSTHLPEWTILEHNLKRRCEALTKWIIRSGSLPLSFFIIIGSNGNDLRTITSGRQISDLTKEMIGALLLCANRWKELEIDASYHTFEYIDQSVMGPLPLLRSLRIACTRTRARIPLGSSPLPKILSVPTIRKLSVEGVPWSLKIQFSSNITQFTYQHSTLSSRDTVTTLRQMPNLVHCKVYLSDIDATVSGVVTLPFLETLYIVSMHWLSGSPSVGVLINCFDAPNLQWFAHETKSLHIYREMSFLNANEPFPALDLVTRCNLDLKKLSFNQCGANQHYMEETFRISPSIVHIQIDLKSEEEIATTNNADIMHFQSFDLGSLVIKNNATSSTSRNFDQSVPVEDILLPNLKIFEAGCVIKITDETVSQFVLSRLSPDPASGVASLQTVKITFFREMQKDISPQILQRAAELGVQINLELIYSPKRSYDPLKQLSDRTYQGGAYHRAYYPYGA